MQPHPIARARVSSPSLAFVALAFLALAICWLPSPGQAHEGHDHGPPAPPLPTTVKPRIAVHSDAYELVAIANGPQLTIYLDRYATNVPIADAAIEITAGPDTLKAVPQPDSTYRVAIPAVEKPGKHELVFNIQHKDGDDLLAGVLDNSQPQPAAAGTASKSTWSALAPLIAVFAALVLGFILGRGTKPAVAAVVGVFALAAIGAPDADAHEGHEPSPVPSSESLGADVPRRLPDGSIFMPKPSQRLISVRTELATPGSASRSQTFVGRIIADPNRAGVVQSITGGRIEALPRGLPRLGQTVKAGEPLVTVVPALPLADQSTIAERGRELEGQIMLGEQRLARLARLTSGNVPRSQVEDIELEIANTRRRLASLREARLQPETLTAPISGVVSASRVVAGQVVQAQDVLFHIVDPRSLWVEALSFDQLDPGAIVAATAVMADGKRMELKLEGRGRALQQQAVVLQFSIVDAPANAVVGLPLSVIARRGETIPGMLLPRDAVVRGGAGEQVVWHHVDPERFVARQVRLEPFDGTNVLVTGGIGPKDRIVVHGAELLSQVR
jgi:cobalt-zinc-cadmium efflux system membrane fusion protein